MVSKSHSKCCAFDMTGREDGVREGGKIREGSGELQELSVCSRKSCWNPVSSSETPLALLLLGCSGSGMGFLAFVSRGILLHRKTVRVFRVLSHRKEREIVGRLSLWKSKQREVLPRGLGLFFFFLIFFSSLTPIIQRTHR